VDLIYRSSAIRAYIARIAPRLKHKIIQTICLSCVKVVQDFDTRLTYETFM